MTLRYTRTFAICEVSKATFEEIAKKFREAGYDHAFEDEGKIIDMHGIALQEEDANASPAE